MNKNKCQKGKILRVGAGGGVKRRENPEKKNPGGQGIDVRGVGRFSEGGAMETSSIVTREPAGSFSNPTIPRTLWLPCERSWLEGTGVPGVWYVQPGTLPC